MTRKGDKMNYRKNCPRCGEIVPDELESSICEACQGEISEQQKIDNLNDNKPTWFTLTKEEFIKRSMKGEVFRINNSIYFFDKNQTVDSPLRVCNINTPDISRGISEWSIFDGKNKFKTHTNFAQ